MIQTAEDNQEQQKKRKFDLHYAKAMHSKGKTYKEIAEHFGTTEQRVKNEFHLDNKAKKEEEQNKRQRGRPMGSRNKSTIAKEQMLANWESSHMSPAMREDKAELNRAAAWFVTECLKLGQTTDLDNLDSMYAALGKYIELCTISGMPMLVKTCQLALGITPTTYARWKNGTYRASDPRYKEFTEMVDSVIGAGIEAAAAAGSIDRVLTIWWEKSHFNMVEGTGMVAEQADPLGEKLTAKEIAQKYDNLPD